MTTDYTTSYNIFPFQNDAIMQRRTFLHTSLALPFLLPAAGEVKRRVIPARLRPGDTVGLITPGSAISADGLAKATRQPESLGLRARVDLDRLEIRVVGQRRNYP